MVTELGCGDAVVGGGYGAAMATRQTGTLAPKLVPVTHGELRPVSVEDFEARDGDDIEAAELASVRLTEVRWELRRRLDSSRLDEVAVGRWHARGAAFSDLVLERLDVLALVAPESGWRDVVVRSSRIGSVELFEANFRRVAFTGCKLGYLNLRDADLADVAFTDCVIEDLDLMRAKAKRVSLAGCRIGRLEVANTRLEDFDLRGATFADISGLEGLRGVTISTDQLLDLAPVLAARLGLKVE